MGRLFRSTLFAGLTLSALGGCSGPSSPESVTRTEDVAEDSANGSTVLWRRDGTDDAAAHAKELRLGILRPVAVPVAVGAPSLDRHVAAGQNHTCVRRPGAVACWGANSRGQLGDGTTENRVSPTTVVNLTDTLSIVAGADTTCALRLDRTVVCWGSNELGQLGNGTTLASTLPTAVEGLTQVAEVVAGSYHTCARRAGGSVACWGSNRSGQIGDGSLDERALPTEVAQLTNIVELAAGRAHTCARRIDGTVACWGHNFYGQVGDPTAPNFHVVPFVVHGLDDAVEISAGHYHTCARRASGQVSCWGQNLKGQLGDGSVDDHATPLAALGMKDVVQVTAGGYHTCARRSSGHVWCWGYNEFGQLGDASFDLRTTPVPVKDLTDAVDVIAGRFGHTCARRGSGAVACWGSNLAGEIGDGTTSDRAIPMNVVGLP